MLLQLHRGAIRAPQIRGFLSHLLRHIAGKIVVLWDGLQAHRSKLVREWVAEHRRIELVRLPAYAPELNPVEGLWSWTKTTKLANVCEESLAPATRRVRLGIRSARRRPNLLWSFLHKARLSL